MGTLIGLAIAVVAAVLVMRALRWNSRRNEGPKKATDLLQVASTNLTLNGEPLRAQESTEVQRNDDDDLAVSIQLRDISGVFCADVKRSPDGRLGVGAAAFGSSTGTLVVADLAAGTLSFRAHMNWPHQPSIANDGRVVVEDWGAQEKLDGALVCFDSSGRRIWTRPVQANVYSSGISPNGTRAFLTTAFAPTKAYSDRLYLLDASTGESVWERSFGRRSPQGFMPRFRDEDLIAAASAPDGTERIFEFDEHGNLGSAFAQLALGKAIAWYGPEKAVLPLVKESLNASPPQLEEAERLLGLVDLNALEATPRAKLLRLQGELHEARGELADAAAAYKEALELYPHVGVKGRLVALEKKLG